MRYSQPFCRASRYASMRLPTPSLPIASDSWALEVVGNTTLGPNAFPCHQLLLARWGIRIGEGVISDGLAEDGVHEFVYFYSPMVAEGATAGGTPPVALAKG